MFYNKPELKCNLKFLTSFLKDKPKKEKEKYRHEKSKDNIEFKALYVPLEEHKSMLKMPFLSNYSLFYSIIPFFLFLSRTKQRTKKTNLKPTKKKALTTSKKPRGSKALWLNFLLLHFKRFKRKNFVIFYTKKQRKGKRERKKEREKGICFFWYERAKRNT